MIMRNEPFDGDAEDCRDQPDRGSRPMSFVPLPPISRNSATDNGRIDAGHRQPAFPHASMLGEQTAAADLTEAAGDSAG